MPEPTFGPDKCQEDKCLNPQVQAFVHRGICPTGGQMPVQAFVLPGICLSRHLSANRSSPSEHQEEETSSITKPSTEWATSEAKLFTIPCISPILLIMIPGLQTPVLGRMCAMYLESHHT